MKKSRVQNRLRLLSAYLAGRSQVDSYPITVIIENTGRCNLACPMCPRNLTQYPPKDFDLELFKRIVDEIRDASELVFPWGLGEPLLNPDVFRMIRYCRDAGLYTVLSTNATLLDEERSRLLIEAGLDHLIIAFDGATRGLRTVSEECEIRESPEEHSALSGGQERTGGRGFRRPPDGTPAG